MPATTASSHAAAATPQLRARSRALREVRSAAGLRVAPTAAPAPRVAHRSCRKQIIRAAAEPPQTEVSSEYYAPGSGKVPPPSESDESYDVYLDKPLGLKFARGFDGAAYIVGVDETKGSIDSRMEPGDKIMKISASFGPDVWDAKNYGQVMYAIRTRNGQVYLNIKRNYGDMTAMEGQEMDEAEAQWRAERGGGNYGAGTKEMQERNYITKKEAERKRREVFNDGMQKFGSGKIEEALIDFEEVIGMEPKNYVGDNFARVTDVYKVTQYNVACCYSSLGQVEPGLDALKAALLAGFEDFKKVRSDPNLAKVREDPGFGTLIDKFDEPVINAEAVAALKNFFSFGKKK
mmetsp:Transcript_40745/g.103203  ORF Transcript_40745/g.103203 Transcript_40745/m.103203 type:complete len:348 (+) Transcript_40745:113-1156(+)